MNSVSSSYSIIVLTPYDGCPITKSIVEHFGALKEAKIDFTTKLLWLFVDKIVKIVRE